MIEIRDGMTAADVWEVIEDILDSVEIIADRDAYLTVRDYVSNTYGD
jgi:hypothetical protein